MLLKQLIKPVSNGFTIQLLYFMFLHSTAAERINETWWLSIYICTSIYVCCQICCYKCQNMICRCHWLIPQFTPWFWSSRAIYLNVILPIKSLGLRSFHTENTIFHINIWYKTFKSYDHWLERAILFQGIIFDIPVAVCLQHFQ